MYIGSVTQSSLYLNEFRVLAKLVDFLTKFVAEAKQIGNHNIQAPQSHNQDPVKIYIRRRVSRKTKIISSSKPITIYANAPFHMPQFLTF